jgi:hypothetical protein
VVDNIIDLGIIQREKIVSVVSNEKKDIFSEVQIFLKTYGLIALNLSVLTEGFGKGRKTIRSLAAWYLNSMLEGKLGPGNIIEGNVEAIVEKFRGLKLFRVEGVGALRWAVDKINKGVYLHLEAAHQVINRGDNPGGGLFTLQDDITGNKFLFDLRSPVFASDDSTRVVSCWSFRSGREFLCVQDEKHKQLFIPCQGQEGSDVIRIARRKWSKASLFGKTN